MSHNKRKTLKFPQNFPRTYTPTDAKPLVTCCPFLSAHSFHSLCQFKLRRYNIKFLRMVQLTPKLYLSISHGFAKVSHTDLSTLQNYVKFVDFFACIRKNRNTFSGCTTLSKLLNFHIIFRLYCFVWM